ncbi:MAG: hypothetical protein WD992_00300 [Candidatus Levyibacteriota bacterium]
MNPFIILLRLVLPLTILRFPIIGGAISVWLDNIDWHNMNFLGSSPFGEYQSIDKALDMYYLSLLAFVGLRFKNLFVRNLLISLFLYRLIGFIFFEITHTQQLLFVFPNIFENFFFFYLILKKVASYEPKISVWMFGFFLILVSIPKMLQEYSMHIVQEPIVVALAGTQHELGTNYQIAYILIFSIAFGLWYRKKRK